MIGVTLSVLLGFLQTIQTGTIVGMVKLPNGGKPAQTAHVILLPPKYTEIWNKQVQQRVDNYWEVFKPEFVAKKEHFMDFYRVAYVESFRYVASTMRRDLGDGASRFMKDTSATGQFEFRGIPIATYQLLVQGTSNGQDIVWSRTVDVQTDVPIFVDLGKPIS